MERRTTRHLATPAFAGLLAFLAIGAAPAQAAPAKAAPAVRATTVRAATPAPAALSVRAASSIRGVDFRNFTYHDGDGRTITVVNGVYDHIADPNDPVYFAVQDVDHGDLDGDGVEEAVVTTLESTGGTGEFTDGLIFRLQNGKAVQIGDLGAGDRADDGIYGITIVNGRMVVDRLGETNSGACCPTYIERSTLRLTPKGPVVVGTPTRRSFVTLDQGGTGAATKITFLPGTSSATVSGDGITHDKAYLDAGKGQSITLTVSKTQTIDNAVAVKVTLSSPTTVLATVTSGGTWAGKLPVTGRYTLALSPLVTPASKDAEAYATVDLSIR